MSKNLSAVAAAQFDDMVQHEYQQQGGLLKGKITQKADVVGDTHNFRRMGKGTANQKPSQADVTPMDITHTKIPCTLANWNAPEYTDIFDDAEVGFDEQSELAYVIGGALGRREDQLILDAVNAESTPAGTVGTDVGGTGTDWNTSKARRMKRLMDQKGVPPKDRCVAISAIGLESLLGTTEATSSDYNTVKALVQGEINTWLGFEWMMIEDRDEGGVPLSGSTRTNLAFQRLAVGIAFGKGFPKTSVDWIPTKTSWLANGMLKAGAVSRNGNGIVKVTTTES